MKIKAPVVDRSECEPTSPTRREFLRFSGFLLAAPALLAGCGGGDGAPAVTATCHADNPTTDADPTIYLADYEPPAFFIDEVELTIDIGSAMTRVQSRLACRRNPDVGPSALILDGRELRTLFVAVDGRPRALANCGQDSSRLTIPDVPDAFVLETIVHIDPAANTSLAGLYPSATGYFTQCEAEDFRRITWFPDRPDVMSRYTVTLIADAATRPLLLANGNLVAQGRLANQRHWATWRDPFKKPCYLFAAVAARLEALHDRFVTMSGRTIALTVYVEPGKLDQCGYAMAALKKAMRWDEERYGLECDLDQYTIVAVSDFNMGAMENKGLNIFNTRYVLADPRTATDADFANIDRVIAHEYFHNWTGNRVTCRDWFQLTLKEGLTVFREQEFAADVLDPTTTRIAYVRALRSHQFPEDASPMAHPIRPASYITIDNFYTATVYEKGAEVVRMIQTLIGRPAFEAGLAEYFRRHDGQAVTCEDFVAAMGAVSGFDFGLFLRWYDQAGTPRVTVSEAFDPQAGRYTLTLTQANPLAKEGQACLLPIRALLWAEDGTALPGTDQTLLLAAPSQSFRFDGLSSKPTPSLLRGFSAPAILDFAYRPEQLLLLLNHESDPFAAWEAGQRLMTDLLLQATAAIAAGEAPDWPDSYFAVVRQLLGQQEARGAALIAECLTLPSEASLTQAVTGLVDADALHAARAGLSRATAERLGGEFWNSYDALAPQGPYRFNSPEMGRRALRNLCLRYLLDAESEQAFIRALAQFEEADNMTDQYAALVALTDHACPQRETALEAFYEQWREEALVIDKWFAVQAASRLEDTLARVQELTQHADFDYANPNRALSLLHTFGANLARFHAADGSGYEFLGEQIAFIDGVNASSSSYLARAFDSWRKYDAGRQAHSQRVLEGLRSRPGISKALSEVVTKLLDVTVQTPRLHGLGSITQTTDSLAPSPLAGEGWGEGV